jgi:hypothetical protein
MNETVVEGTVDEIFLEKFRVKVGMTTYGGLYSDVVSKGELTRAKRGDKVKLVVSQSADGKWWNFSRFEIVEPTAVEAPAPQDQRDKHIIRENVLGASLKLHEMIIASDRWGLLGLPDNATMDDLVKSVEKFAKRFEEGVLR